MSGAPFHLTEYNNTVLFGLFPSRTVHRNATQIYNDVNLLQLPAANNNPLYIGNVQGTTTWFLNGNMAEMIIYNGPVNSAHHHQQLSEREVRHGIDQHGHLLPGPSRQRQLRSRCSRDRAAQPQQHPSRFTRYGRRAHQQCTGLANNEFLIWGHDNGVLGAGAARILPVGLQGRWHRIWRVNEVNQTGGAIDVGNVNITFDLDRAVRWWPANSAF